MGYVDSPRAAARALDPPLTTTTELHHHQIQMTSSSLTFPFPFLGGHHVHAPPPSSSAQLLPPAAPHFPFQLQQQAPGGAAPPQHDHLMIHQLSPAARLSAIEQAAAASARSSGGTAAADVGLGGGLLPPFPSILSPGSLPAIPPSFFSPPASAGNSYPPGISLFGGLISPAFLGNETTGGGSMSMSIAAIAGASHQSVMPSPSTVTPSPSAGAYYWDLFNNQQLPSVRGRSWMTSCMSLERTRSSPLTSGRATGFTIISFPTDKQHRATS